MPKGIRTPDPLLRREMLCPSELLAHIFGATKQIRTADLRFTNPLLYLLSYRSILYFYIKKDRLDSNQ